MLGSLEYFNEFYADYQKTIKNWNYAEDGVAFYLCANYYICNNKLSQSSWQVFKMLFINTRAEKKYFFSIFRCYLRKYLSKFVSHRLRHNFYKSCCLSHTFRNIENSSIGYDQVILKLIKNIDFSLMNWVLKSTLM